MPAQIKIINEVNRFLSQEDAPILLNTEGICAGLAVVYIKYRLEGKKDEFFRLCRQLASLPPHYKFSEGDKLALFIRDIEIAFNTTKYTKGKAYQGELENQVFIDGKPIKREFDIGLVESKEQWAKIFAQMSNEGRSYYIQSPNHAIAVTCVNGQYEIYDPNYDEDQDVADEDDKSNIKLFSTATDLIDELARQFGYCKNNLAGFSIHAYAHPDDRQKTSYPDKKAIFATSLNGAQAFQRKLSMRNDNRNYNSFNFACDARDVETIHYIVEKDSSLTQQELLPLLLREANNAIVWEQYRKSDKSGKRLFLSSALYAGNQSLFIRMLSDYQDLIKHSSYEQHVFKNYLTEEFYFLVIASKAYGSPSFKQVLDLYHEYGIDLSGLPLSIINTIVTELTRTGSQEALQLFADHMPLLSEATIRLAVETAVLEDRHGALTFWLEKLPEMPLKNNYLSKLILQKSSLYSFELLLKKGFNIHSTSLRELLKRKNPEFFELWLAYHTDSCWVEFVKKMRSGNLEDRIDLFQKKEGLSAFQILTRYQLNDVIRDNWRTLHSEPLDDDALLFACECSNKDMVAFLTEKGYVISTEPQLRLLQQAVEVNDCDQITAILTSSIRCDEFFTKENEKLIGNLIKRGHYQFITRNWHAIEPEQQKKYLGFALHYDNQSLYKSVINDAHGKSFCMAYIQEQLAAIKKNRPARLIMDKIIKLSDALDEISFNQLFTEETSTYRSKISEHIPGENLEEDTLFYQETRKEIAHLVTLHHYSLSRQYLRFADRIKFFAPLTLEEQYRTFTRTYRQAGSIAHLLHQYPAVAKNQAIYFRLENDKEYGLLALLLAEERCLDPEIYRQLLHHAVEREDEKIIAILRDYIDIAHKPEGLPLYKALAQGNIAGSIFLLRHGASYVGRSPLAQKLLWTAVQQDDVALLKTALQNPGFKEFFYQQFEGNSELIFKLGKPAVVLFISEMVFRDQDFPSYLHCALAADDLDLFRKLQSQPQFIKLDKKELFHQACASKALNIANEVLATPLRFDDQKALHQKLDQLFDGLEARAIYEKVYKEKKLVRLYEFVKREKYRPFASLHASIEEFIFDPRLSRISLAQTSSGVLRNRLIANALDEADHEVLKALYEQSESKPELNIDLFAENLAKPLVLRVLLEHYPLDQVLAAALEHHQWPTIVALLKDSHTKDIDEELLRTLQQQDQAIMDALIEDAMNHLQDDPRHQLNTLLCKNCPLALSVILAGKKPIIEQTIMAVQNHMVKSGIDLKRHFYDFELYYSLLNDFQNTVAEFLDTFGKQPLTKIILDGSTRRKLINLRDTLQTWQLSTGDVDSSGQLPLLFDILDKYTTEPEQFEAWCLEESGKQEPSDCDDEIQPETTDKDERHSIIEPNEEQPVAMPAPKPSAKKALTGHITDYQSTREKGGKTHHILPFFQYTREDKLEAVQRLQGALSDDPKDIRMIRKRDRGALNNGLLGRTITQFLKDNPSLALESGSTDALISVNSLIDDLNRHNVDHIIQALINDILDYRKTREDDIRDTYHFFAAAQFTKTDKCQAAEHLVALLQCKENHFLTPRDIKALQQGTLGNTVCRFIKEYSLELTRAYESDKPIKNLNDLITACDNRINHQSNGNNQANNPQKQPIGNNAYHF
ncbi:hypothetical protein [Legionella spiritensis]|uniref:Ankyrin repeat-containing protein n=1 Tax=Legionella spiritensis TaxID=452 RepID=A0A0W0ZB59_LEGSP|nr:hypothetical protein [Legionella spiritensis]KTD66202.1 ankyrin repeat-containing protein [Legionella spiritensis]SNV35215.1 ankyrin repeat-containing protein [Legionella spiritensis]